MGGGDIKLMATLGLALGYKMAVLAIFLASFIALPISLYIIKNNKSHIIPFGPFLAISAIILLFLQIDFNNVISYLTI